MAFTLQLVILLLTAPITFTSACSPPEGDYEEPSLTDRVHSAEIVLYGLILETYNDTYFDTAYTALMQVYCVIKGAVVPNVLNISDAGYVPALCHSTDLAVGEEYIVTLYNGSRGFIPNDSAISADDLSEVVRACGLTPMYPDGVDSSTYAGKQCPADADPDDCETANAGSPSAAPHLAGMGLLLISRLLTCLV